MSDKIASILKEFSEKFQSDPTDVTAQRRLEAALTSSLASSESDTSFMVGLVYKLLLSDVLRNSIEDDIIPAASLEPVMRSLATSMNAVPDRDWERVCKGLIDFAGHYRRAIRSSLPGEILKVRGLKFFVSRTEDPPLIGSKQKFPAFFDLDANLADSRTSRKIVDWYTATIRATVKRNPRNINVLCFVEKSYSVVGALSLMPLLTQRLGIPSMLYRASYWDPDSRLGGNVPPRGANIILVYDVILGGDALMHAADFLRSQHSADVSHAVVYFDYEQGGVARLADEGIAVQTASSWSDVEQDIGAQLELLASLRAEPVPA